MRIKSLVFGLLALFFASNAKIYSQSKTVILKVNQASLEECSSGIDYEINKNLEEPGLKLFPNPSEGIVTISFFNWEPGSVKLSIVNELGQTVYLDNVNSNDVGIHEELDLNMLPKGIYFVIVRSKSDCLVERFLII